MEKTPFIAIDKKRPLSPIEVEQGAGGILAAKHTFIERLNDRLGFNASSDLLTYHELLVQTRQWIGQLNQSITASRNTVTVPYEQSLVALLTQEEDSGIILGAFHNLKCLYIQHKDPVAQKMVEGDTGLQPLLREMMNQLRHEETGVFHTLTYVAKREDQFRHPAYRPDERFDRDVQEKVVLRKRHYRVKERIWDQVIREGGKDVVGLPQLLHRLQQGMRSVVMGIRTDSAPLETYDAIAPSGDLGDLYNQAITFVRDKRPEELAHLDSFELSILAQRRSWDDTEQLAKAIEEATDDPDFRIQLLIEGGIISRDIAREIDRIEAFQEIAWLYETVKATGHLYADRILAHYFAPYIEKGISVDFLFSVVEDGLVGTFAEEIQAAYAQFSDRLTNDEAKGRGITIDYGRIARAAVGAAILLTLAYLIKQCQNPEQPISIPTPTPTPTTTATSTIDRNALLFTPPPTELLPIPPLTPIPLTTSSHSLPTFTPTTTFTPTPTPTVASTPIPIEVSGMATPAVEQPEEQKSDPLGERLKEIREKLEEKRGEVEGELREFAQNLPENMGKWEEQVQEQAGQYLEQFKEAQKDPWVVFQEHYLLALLTALARLRAKRSYKNELHEVVKIFGNEKRVKNEVLALLSYVAEYPRGDFIKDFLTVLFFPPAYPFLWTYTALEKRSTHRLHRGINQYGGIDGLREHWNRLNQEPSTFLSKTFGFNDQAVRKAHILTKVQTWMPHLLEAVDESVRGLGLDDSLTRFVQHDVRKPFLLIGNPDAFLTSALTSGGGYHQRVKTMLAIGYKVTARGRRNKTWWSDGGPDLFENPQEHAQRVVMALPGLPVIEQLLTYGHQADFFFRLGLLLTRPRETVVVVGLDPNGQVIFDIRKRKEILKKIVRNE